MEELEQLGYKLDTYVLRKLERNRLPTTSRKLEQMQAKDEIIAKFEPPQARNTIRPMKFEPTRENEQPIAH